MAGLVSSFVSGNQLKISIGQRDFAFAQGLSFTEDMTQVPVGGIGSASYHALEPTQYMASGSMILTRYSNNFIQFATQGGQPVYGAPSSLPQPLQQGNDASNDGNSMLIDTQFSPHLMLFGATFDIKVFNRITGSYTEENQMFTLHDCRLTGYSFSFTPGQLVQEVVTFLCINVQDHQLTSDSEYTPYNIQTI